MPVTCDADHLPVPSDAKPRFDSSGKTPASCHDPANAIASPQLSPPGAAPPRADGEPDRRDQEVERADPGIAGDIRDRRRRGHRALSDEEAACQRRLATAERHGPLRAKTPPAP